MQKTVGPRRLGIVVLAAVLSTPVVTQVQGLVDSAERRSDLGHNKAGLFEKITTGSFDRSVVANSIQGLL